MAVLVIVLEIVLDGDVAGCEIALRELVNIDIVVTSEKVLDNLVVLRAVPAESGSTLECEILREHILGSEAEVQVILVLPPLLLHIFGAVPLRVEAGIHIVPVDIVHPVPVDMADIIVVVGPGLLGPACLERRVTLCVVLVLIVEIARQVPVIVRARVCRIIPVEG